MMSEGREEKVSVEARAQRGQINRTRILEYQLKQANLEMEKRLDERLAAVKKVEELTKLLNSERAQRLGDMHTAFRDAADKTNAHRELKEMEKKFYVQQSLLADVRDRCAALEAAFDAHSRVTQRSLDANDNHLREIERHRAEILLLRKSLFEAEEHGDRLHVVVEAQRDEIYSLRTQLVRNGKTNALRTLKNVPTLAFRAKTSDHISSASRKTMPVLERPAYKHTPQLDTSTTSNTVF